MVSIAAIVVVIALFYYALWQPLNNGLAEARNRVTAESNQARWMLGVRDEARVLQASDRHQAPIGGDQSLLSIIDKTSRANDLGEAVTHIQPNDDDQATVTLDAANFNRMLFWLQNLQSRYGIAANEATISREDDSPGEVEARLTLARGQS